MGRKKLVCIFLVCLVMIGSFCIPAGAVKNATQETSIVMRATGKFDVDVPNGDYKVCIINAGSKSITGALQYEVK